MCSVPCVCEYFQLCQSATTQILLDRKGVVYLNSAWGFGSTELKLTVCINSLFFGWHDLSHYAHNTWSPWVKGRAWEGKELQWINTWLHIWCQQESGNDNYGTQFEDWNLLGAGETHLTKWRVCPSEALWWINTSSGTKQGRCREGLLSLWKDLLDVWSSSMEVMGLLSFSFVRWRT